MHCDYGGEVTFTRAEPGYHLRIYNGTTLSVILSIEDVRRLQERIHDVLREEEE